jgi:hypothetical protein
MTRRTRYLYFNKDAAIDPYCILFHDANPACGHYEPLLYKKLSTCNLEEPNAYLSLMCKNLECHWNSMMHKMLTHGLRRAITNTSSCGDSLFVAICYLIAKDFNVQSLRLYIVQSFCNAITSNAPNALHFLHRHLPCNVIHHSEITNSWQEYLVKIAMPYHKGKIEITWGDLENAIEQLHNNPLDIDATFKEQTPTKFHCEQYDLQQDLNCPQDSLLKKTVNLGFQVTHHPLFHENEEYYRLRSSLNREQQAIVKDIALKKSMDIQKPLHLFLTGGAGTGKNFTAKTLFQMLIRIYDAHNTIDPLKPKGLILAYTGRAAYNASGTTIHSALLMPFNKSHFLPLGKDMLDTLSKLYQELQLVFIDEASLIGSRFLFGIDNRLRNIKHTQTKYFGNIDVVFCGDFYQAQPIQDSLIFEKPTMDMQTVTYDFWKDNVMCYELQTTMRQTNEKFIAILNRMRTNSQTSNDLTYINMNCMRPAPNDPTFPYLFYKNKDVALHNKHMLSIMPSNKLLINAIDEEEEYHGNVPHHQHTSTLSFLV